MASRSSPWDREFIFGDRCWESSAICEESGLLRAELVQENSLVGFLEVRLPDQARTVPEQLQEDESKVG